MQIVDLDEFPNSSEWTVAHDLDSQMFTLKSKTGHTLNGRYTNRRMAEVALYNYLKDIASKPSKGRKSNKTLSQETDTPTLKKANSK